jgi:hypothetical protein
LTTSRSPIGRIGKAKLPTCQRDRDAQVSDRRLSAVSAVSKSTPARKLRNLGLRPVDFDEIPGVAPGLRYWKSAVLNS